MRKMRKSKKKLKKRSTAGRLWRMLGSPKATLFIGIIVLASIIYFQQKTKRFLKKKKPVQHLLAKEGRPLLDSKFLLGRMRKDGPVFSRQFFRTGDFIIRRKDQKLQFALVQKGSDGLFVLTVEAKRPLAPWLKEAGGYFALFRLDRRTNHYAQKLFGDSRSLTSVFSRLRKGSGQPSQKATTRKATSRPQNLLLPFFIELFQRHGTHFPKFGVATEEGQLRELVKKSHYNELGIF